MSQGCQQWALVVASLIYSFTALKNSWKNNYLFSYDVMIFSISVQAFFPLPWSPFALFSRCVSENVTACLPLPPLWTACCLCCCCALALWLPPRGTLA